MPDSVFRYKPLPGGGAAIFVANHGSTPTKVKNQTSRSPDVLCQCCGCAMTVLWLCYDCAVVVLGL